MQLNSDKVPLGKTSISIGKIGLGTVTFGREIGEDKSYELMDYALEKGLTWFDTAEGYGGGQSKSVRKAVLGIDDRREITLEMSSSEKIIGRWLKKTGNYKTVTICTKVSTGGYPDNIPRAIIGSMERLGVDCLDIYKLHSPTVDVPISETLHSLTQEIHQGHLGVIGCSNFSFAQLQESLDVSRKNDYGKFAITQPAYNLVLRDCEDDFFDLCTRDGIAVTPHSPLGNGFLTGKYTTDKANVPKGSRMDIAPGHMNLYWNDKGFRIDQKLREKSKELGIPIPRLAMAWVMSNSQVTSVIIGARETSHIDNAIEAHEMLLDQDLRDEMSSWVS